MDRLIQSLTELSTHTEASVELGSPNQKDSPDMQDLVPQPIRLAIVGCGAITRLAHLQAALRSPWIQLHSLVDTTIKNAQEVQREYALDCKVVSNLEEVIGEVEGVLIATPNHTHLAVGSIALTRGIPTLIEKPLATTYTDAVKLCELAEKHNTFISVGFRSRYWTGVKLLKQILDQGYLGKIQRFDYEVGNTGSWNSISGYMTEPAQSGGGTLIDAHVLDKLLYWFGEPVSFTYADDNYGGVEANCRGTLSYSGAKGSFTGSYFLSRTTALKNRIEIVGDRYTCRLEEKETGLPTLEGPDCRGFSLEVNPPLSVKEPAQNSFMAQLEEFARNVRKRSELTVDGRFAALSVKWTEKMYQARQTLDEPWIVRTA